MIATVTLTPSLDRHLAALTSGTELSRRVHVEKLPPQVKVERLPV